MDFKKILTRGAILGIIIILITCVSFGIVDFVVFAIIGLLVLIFAALMTIIHNQRGD